jgi:glycosyltransferase involved in cell wall biosynthesis
VPPFLSLIIPAYNEEQRLPRTLQQIHEFIEAQSYRSEVIVVENGSTDSTHAIAAAFSAAHPKFRVERAAQRGKGRAVRQGMLAAGGEFRMMLDADLSMPVSEINRFLPPISQAEIVIGSREAPGAVRYNEPSYRHVGGRVINGMIKLLALPGLQDTQCGFKCFTAKSAEFLFRRQTLTGWSFDIEILYIARLHGLNMLELPIPWYYSDQSHVRPIPDTAHMFLDILRIRGNASKGLYA